MTGRLHSFAHAKAAALAELVTAAPALTALAGTAPAAAMTTLMALSRCHLSVAQRPNDMAAILTCKPSLRGDRLALALKDHFADVMAQPFGAPNARAQLHLEDWIDSHGFLDLVSALVEASATQAEISALADTIALAVNRLYQRLVELAHRHFENIIARDMPDYPSNYQSLGPIAYWAFASDHCRQSQRDTILVRRRQALAAYGGIASAFLDPAISAIVDAAQPLKEPLAAHLGLSQPQLRTLLEARSFEQVIKDSRDYLPAIRTLCLHEVPLHEWPRGNAWNAQRFNVRMSQNLFRPDYVESTEARDAIAGFQEDLLRPLAADRASHLGLADNFVIQRFLADFSLPSSFPGCDDHRLWLRALRHAVVGPRGIKSFQEAVAAWHRRAATLAAVRHEHKTERPGWPALCAPWHAPDGTHAIVPLTSADDLVHEGQAMDHCVGGYYPQCRSGGTQILSLRCKGEPRATLELLLSFADNGGFTIRVGQFKAHHNRKPEPALHAVLRQFLDDLQAGRHAMARAPLMAHHKAMARTGDHVWRSHALPLDHACRTWPLYQTLLPKGLPPTFDAWATSSGLAGAIDTILTALARATA